MTHGDRTIREDPGHRASNFTQAAPGTVGNVPRTPSTRCPHVSRQPYSQAERRGVSSDNSTGGMVAVRSPSLRSLSLGPSCPRLMALGALTMCCILALTRAVTPTHDIELWLEDYTRPKARGGRMQADSPLGVEEEVPHPRECPVTAQGHLTTLACLLPKCRTDLDCLWPAYKCCPNGCLETCTPALPPPAYVDWRREPARNPRTGISWLIQEPHEPGEVSSPQTCRVDGTTYKSGEKFRHHSHHCKCHKGSVDCSVSRFP